MNQVEQVGFSTGCLYRSDWSLENKVGFLERVGQDNLELNFLRPDGLLQLDPSEKLIERVNLFKRVSIHAPSKVLYGNNLETQRILEKLFQLFTRISVDSIVVHPSNVDDFSALERSGMPFIIENLGGRKNKWSEPGEFGKLARDYPFGFILDTQHVFEVDPTMQLGFELIDSFAGRLKQMHVSGYTEGEIHYPLHCADNRYAVSKFLKSAPVVPKIAEGVITKNMRMTARLEYDYLRHHYMDAVWD